MTSQTDYSWAYNKLKLKQSFEKLVELKKINPSIIITEDLIKGEYIAKKGLLLEEQEKIAKVKRPRSTSNIDNKNTI